MTGTPTPDFLRIFTVHRECCRRLLDLSRSQDRLIEENDYDELLAVLGKKQQVLDQIAKFEEHRPRIKSMWKSLRGQLDDTLRGRCESLLDETAADLEELVRQEHRSSREIERRRAGTQQELRNLDQGERVQAAYRDSLAPVTHRRLDVGQ